MNRHIGESIFNLLKYSTGIYQISRWYAIHLSSGKMYLLITEWHINLLVFRRALPVFTPLVTNDPLLLTCRNSLIWYIFEVKLTFEMITVRGQQHSFSTYERMFLWKCQSFWDRKCFSLRGTWTLNLRTYAECSNRLSYHGQTFAVPCFLILAMVV